MGWKKVKIIPPGAYRAVVINVEPKESKHTGRTYWMATYWLFESGSKTIHHPLMGYGPATWVWRNVVDHPRQLLGKELLVTVDTQTWDRVTRSRVARIAPYPEGGKMLDNEETRRLEERLATVQNEIQSLTDETFAIKNELRQVEKKRYVQVQFTGSTARYTYEVDQPSQINDWVSVPPTSHSPFSSQLAQVVALGRGSWKFGVKGAHRLGNPEEVIERVQAARNYL